MPEREFVAFVRAVMVGRDGLHRDVLVDAFADSGATHVMSHISTGNVSFRAPKTSLGELGAAVEERLEAIVGRRTELLIRSVAELEAIRNRDPFAGSPLTGDHERLVTFLLGPPPDDLALPITGFGGDVVVFAVGARELFSVAAKHDGRSRGPGGVIERSLVQRVTTRAWSTIDRILMRAR